MDTGGLSQSSPKRSQSSMSSPNKSKSLKELKNSKQSAKKELNEKNKVKRAEKNVKIFFETLKRHLEKNDDEYLLSE